MSSVTPRVHHLLCSLLCLILAFDTKLSVGSDVWKNLPTLTMTVVFGLFGAFFQINKLISHSLYPHYHKN